MGISFLLYTKSYSDFEYTKNNLNKHVMRKFHHKTDMCKPSVWLATFLCLPVNYKSIEYPMICQFCLFYSTLPSEKTDNVVYDETV